MTPTQPIQGRATAEEIQRVRDTECANAGHSYDVVSAVGRNAPLSILCSNCGKSWAVEGTEEER